MINRLINDLNWNCGWLAAAALVLVGCSKSNPDVLTPARNPKEAASQLQNAFTSSNPEMKDEAQSASAALQTSDYDKAIQSLERLRNQPNLTFDQGMAVYNSTVSLEGRLIAAMNSGDPKAKQAYERLKASRRE